MRAYPRISKYQTASILCGCIATSNLVWIHRNFSPFDVHVNCLSTAFLVLAPIGTFVFRLIEGPCSHDVARRIHMAILLCSYFLIGIGIYSMFTLRASSRQSHVQSIHAIVGLFTTVLTSFQIVSAVIGRLYPNVRVFDWHRILGRTIVHGAQTVVITGIAIHAGRRHEHKLSSTEWYMYDVATIMIVLQSGLSVAHFTEKETTPLPQSLL